MHEVGQCNAVWSNIIVAKARARKAKGSTNLRMPNFDVIIYDSAIENRHDIYCDLEDPPELAGASLSIIARSLLDRIHNVPADDVAAK
jgi:hypothetical protein